MSSVQEAIKAGRLSRSVTREGKIADAVLADAEWMANTRAERAPLSGPGAKRNTARDLVGGESDAPTLGEARARLDAAKAELAELDLAGRRGEVVLAKDLEARLVSTFSSCKTKLMGIPSRARQQDPALTAEQLALFEGLIREALEGLAAEGGE